MPNAPQLFNYIGAGASASATSYAPIVGFGGIFPTATEANNRCIMPCSGTINGMSIYLAAAPGAGRSWTYTLRVNGVDSALSVTVANPAVTGSSFVDVAVSAGDIVNWKITPSGTPTGSAACRILTEFTPDVANQFAYHGGIASTLVAINTYSSLLHYTSSIQSTDSNILARDIVAMDNGTIRNFYVSLASAPPAGVDYTFVINKNGVEEASSVVTVTSASATVSVSGLSIAVARGDMLGFKVKAKTGTGNARQACWGLVIEPAVSGEFMWAGTPRGGFYATPGSSLNWGYTYATTNLGDGNSAEALNALPFPLLFKNLIVKLVTAPGVGHTRTFTNVQSSGGTPTVTIAGASVDGVDTAEYTLPAGGTFHLNDTASASTAGSSGNHGIVCRVLAPGLHLRTLMGVGL